VGDAGKGKVLGVNRQPLPSSEGLDIEALSQILDDTTNSYKILFFKSILTLIKRGQIGRDRQIPLTDVASIMLCSAWITAGYFKLSLGSRDQLLDLLTKLPVKDPALGLTNTRFEHDLESSIKSACTPDTLKTVERYVVCRLIRPFFQAETKGLPDAKVNRELTRLAAESFRSNKPAPYLIEDQSIVLHEDWYSYFCTHLRTLSDWADWNLTLYLQRRNPNAPAIANKLYLPNKRGSLSLQREMWTTLCSEGDLRCLYSGEVLKPQDLHLDHYLPWSYVCHDEPWNLAPVHPLVNSSKGNSLPADRYLLRFIELQACVLQACKRSFAEGKKWKSVCASYAAGLRLTGEALTDIDALSKALHDTITSGTSIAKAMGFKSGWEYFPKVNLAV